MAYVAPTVRSVGDAVTAADYNIMANDVIAHQSVMSNVVYATYGTAVSNATLTYATSNLSATITPLSTASRIRVEYHVEGLKVAGDVNTAMNLIVLVGATQIATTERNNTYNTGTSADVIFTVNDAFIHSPATTSATTYTLHFRSTRTQTVTLHPYGSQSVGHMILTEIPA